MKRVIILGASGSIGKQTLQVMKKSKDFVLVGFSVGQKVNKAISILKQYPTVESVFVSNVKDAVKVLKKFPEVKVFHSENGLIRLLNSVDYDITVNALVGFVGLEPTLHVLEQDKILCLANKESLVVGGELVKQMLLKGKGKLYPIDSEHVAIRKCLESSKNKKVKSIILTASGGAFRGLKLEETYNLKASDALRHPTWKMGPKITIDSATMMNKCFEVIEAYYLFDYELDYISILMHDTSTVHSLIQYEDGSLRADIGKPDMKKPIKWALYEGQVSYKTKVGKTLAELGNYYFKEFDINRYPLVRYAREVINHKGAYGAVLNAANEEAVYGFLRGDISFFEIDKIIDHCMAEVPALSSFDYQSLRSVDLNTRQKVKDLIRKE